MNIVSYGGGTNSTAELIGLYRNEIPVDLILFADTGAERPETYEYVHLMDVWLQRKGMPGITWVSYTDKDGNRLTLEEECLRSKTLPSKAYGSSKCSHKHKIGTQDKYCNNNDACKAVWKGGKKVKKFVGYDAGEERRKNNALVYDLADKKYEKVYPLIDWWDWDREQCVEVIKSAGLPLPGKSACFFCPSAKKHEIRELKRVHPDLYKRAIELEENAKENLLTLKGLGRDWSWGDYIYSYENQITMCAAFREIDIPCGCYDG